VLLDGTLTVRTITAAHAALLKTLTEQQEVYVDCGAAESVDLSLIQLLLSARLSARQEGKHIALAAPVAGPLRAVLEQAGLLSPTGGDPFWSGEP